MLQLHCMFSMFQILESFLSSAEIWAVTLIYTWTKDFTFSLTEQIPVQSLKKFNCVCLLLVSVLNLFLALGSVVSSHFKSYLSLSLRCHLTGTYVKCDSVISPGKGSGVSSLTCKFGKSSHFKWHFSLFSISSLRCYSSLVWNPVGSSHSQIWALFWSHFVSLGLTWSPTRRLY